MLHRIMIRALVCAAVMLATTAAQADRIALLVGVNEYTSDQVTDLGGCVNDANLVRQLLTSQLGFPAENIKMLTDADATAANILATLKSHLVDNSKPGDFLVFYFSGHGSFVADDNGDEDDNYDEILCSSDVSTGPNTFVRDDDLAKIADQLTDREFVSIFDCCHSGTGIRSILMEGTSKYHPMEPVSPVSTRSILEAPTDRPTTRSMARPAFGEAGSRSTSAAAVLLAACRSDEVAQETAFRAGNEYVRHGAFTYKLAECIRAMGAANTLTYGKLKSLMESPLITGNRQQHPQVECPPSLIDRPFLPSSGQASTPAQQTSTPSATLQAIPQPSSQSHPQELPQGIQKLAVYVASLAELANDPGAANDPQTKEKIVSLVAQRKNVRIANSRRESDIAVAYAQKGSEWIICTINHGGAIQKRTTVSTISESALEPIFNELRRLYAVNSLMEVSTSGSKPLVTAKLKGDVSSVKLDDDIVLQINSERSGYLTVINVDCQGNVTQLVPNEHRPTATIRQGEMVTIPELYAMAPVGEEFMKIFVTEAPLSINILTRGIGGSPYAGLTDPDQSADMVDFLIRAVGVRPRPTVQTQSAAGSVAIENLAPGEFGETSFAFTTYE